MFSKGLFLRLWIKVVEHCEAFIVCSLLLLCPCLKEILLVSQLIEKHIRTNFKFPKCVKKWSCVTSYLVKHQNFSFKNFKRRKGSNLDMWHITIQDSLCESSRVWAQTLWTDCRTHAIDWTLQGSNSSLPPKPDGVSRPLLLYCHQTGQLISPTWKTCWECRKINKAAPFQKSKQIITLMPAIGHGEKKGSRIMIIFNSFPI